MSSMRRRANSVAKLGEVLADPSTEERLEIVLLAAERSNASVSFETVVVEHNGSVSRVGDLATWIAALRKAPMRIGVWWERAQSPKIRAGLREVRACGVRSPILVVLERVEAADRVELRRIGADDVVEAVRGNEEILLRSSGLARLVRRYRVRTFCKGALRMDPDGRWVRCNDSGVTRSKHFAQQEFDFLLIHARHEGKPVPYRLADTPVFGRDMRANRGKRTNVKNKVVHKLQEISERKSIDNVRGIGYMFVDDK